SRLKPRCRSFPRSARTAPEDRFARDVRYGGHPWLCPFKRTCTESLPNAISSAHSQAVSDGLAEKVVTPLSQHLTQHVRACLAAVSTVRSRRRPHGRRSAVQ